MALTNITFNTTLPKAKKNKKLSNLNLHQNIKEGSAIPKIDFEDKSQLLNFSIFNTVEDNKNYDLYQSEIPVNRKSKLAFLKNFKNFLLFNFKTGNSLFDNISGLSFFFKNNKKISSYIFQGRVSYVPLISSLNYRFFFSVANHWITLREFFFIYEFLTKHKNDYHNFFLRSNNLYFFASMLLYEKLNYKLIGPLLLKNFFNFSECLLKIRLTTSNIFFTALDSVSHKTLLTGTGGMLQLPISKFSNIIKARLNASKKKLVLRQDIKYKKSNYSGFSSANQSHSKKFSKKQNQNIINKKKRPRWIEKTSFNSLFHLCDKFFNALKDFGYLQLRFWLVGYKVYNTFFKKKILIHWKNQYLNHMFLSPYIIFQVHKCHNGMRLKKARRV